MGIYIPGMKMPKDCRECPFFGYTAEDDFMCLIQDGEDTCRLEEIPPHGRLIDADEAARNVSHHDESGYAVCGVYETPTVIPAEEGGVSDD